MIRNFGTLLITRTAFLEEFLESRKSSFLENLNPPSKLTRLLNTLKREESLGTKKLVRSIRVYKVNSFVNKRTVFFISVKSGFFFGNTH